MEITTPLIVGKLMRELGLKMMTKKDRMWTVRTFYLLLHFHFDCGHAFNWYTGGPHSVTLDSDIYSVLGSKEYQKKIKKISFQKLTEERLAQFKKELKRIHSFKMMDLVSCLCFIYLHWVDHEDGQKYTELSIKQRGELMQILLLRRLIISRQGSTEQQSPTIS